MNKFNDEFSDGKLSDDLNDWSKRMFEDVTKMFQKTIKGGSSLSNKEHTTDPDVMFDKVPNRETVITDDDVLNVRIGLENANTIDDILKMM